MSIRWCGTCARSAALGLAVPMSMPRYTCAESTLMISRSTCRASASASALLPLAVGPASTSARGVIAASFGASSQHTGCANGGRSDERVRAGEVDHALDLAIAQAAPAQGVGGFEQVFQRGAEAPLGMLEDVHQVAVG